jgi:hypothetical protein
MQLLQQLSEGLAIAVLAASPADLEHHLSILPAGLHPLAIEAAFPSIRQHHSLTLDLSLLGSIPACEVLHAANTATSALQKLDVQNIPLWKNESLVQAIRHACTSPSNVSLSFASSSATFNIPEVEPLLQPLLQVSEPLSRNAALTSLQLIASYDPANVFDTSLDCLLAALTGLQSLTLEEHRDSDMGVYLNPFRSAPACINALLHLTHLHLRLPSFDLTNLQQVLHPLKRLHVLELGDNEWLRELPPVSTLTALQTLKVFHCENLHALSPLASLAALQSLNVNCCDSLEHFPELNSCISLRRLDLRCCRVLKLLPSLSNLTSLQTLDLGNCFQLQEVPLSVTMTALQTLGLYGCSQLQRLPPLDRFTALQMLDVTGCDNLRELPPLAPLTTRHLRR